MVGCSRPIKIIFLTLCIYIITINIIIWANSPTIYDYSWTSPLWIPQTFNSFHKDGMNKYYGFSYFFEQLSTFPALYLTKSYCDTYLNLLSGFTITGVGVLDWVIRIFNILAAPITLGVTVIVDLLNNIAWLFVFFNKFPNSYTARF